MRKRGQTEIDSRPPPTYQKKARNEFDAHYLESLMRSNKVIELSRIFNREAAQKEFDEYKQVNIDQLTSYVDFLIEIADTHKNDAARCFIAQGLPVISKRKHRLDAALDASKISFPAALCMHISAHDDDPEATQAYIKAHAPKDPADAASSFGEALDLYKLFSTADIQTILEKAHAAACVAAEQRYAEPMQIEATTAPKSDRAAAPAMPHDLTTIDAANNGSAADDTATAGPANADDTVIVPPLDDDAPLKLPKPKSPRSTSRLPRSPSSSENGSAAGSPDASDSPIDIVNGTIKELSESMLADDQTHALLEGGLPALKKMLASANSNYTRGHYLDALTDYIRLHNHIMIYPQPDYDLLKNEVLVNILHTLSFIRAPSWTQGWYFKKRGYTDAQIHYIDPTLLKEGHVAGRGNAKADSAAGPVTFNNDVFAYMWDCVKKLDMERFLDGDMSETTTTYLTLVLFRTLFPRLLHSQSEDTYEYSKMEEKDRVCFYKYGLDLFTLIRSSGKTYKTYLPDAQSFFYNSHLVRAQNFLAHINDLTPKALQTDSYLPQLTNIIHIYSSLLKLPLIDRHFFDTTFTGVDPKAVVRKSSQLTTLQERLIVYLDALQKFLEHDDMTPLNCTTLLKSLYSLFMLYCDLQTPKQPFLAIAFSSILARLRKFEVISPETNLEELELQLTHINHWDPSLTATPPSSAGSAAVLSTHGSATKRSISLGQIAALICPRNERNQTTLLATLKECVIADQRGNTINFSRKSGPSSATLFKHAPEADPMDGNKTDDKSTHEETNSSQAGSAL